MHKQNSCKNDCFGLEFQFPVNEILWYKKSKYIKLTQANIYKNNKSKNIPQCFAPKVINKAHCTIGTRTYNFHTLYNPCSMKYEST